MATPYIGEIRAVGFNFAPPGWYPCNGQSLNISAEPVLFQLIGITYGGDGQTTFNVPDLNGRVAVGAGQPANGSNYQLGQVGGINTVTLNAGQLPAHGHSFALALAATTSGTATNNPAGALPGSGANAYAGAPSGTATLAAGAITGTANAAGGSGAPQAHANMPPVLAINYIICSQGLYPPQPQ